MANTADVDAIIPSVIWAQRKDRLLITIQLVDVRNENIQLDESRLKFSAVAGPDGKKYAVTIEFLKEVNPEESKQKKDNRQIFFNIKKKVEEEHYWPRLTTASSKLHWLRTDFNRWMDEDEDDEEGANGDGNMNLDEMMQQMSSMNGGEADEEDDGPDSDDEDLPDLE